MIAKHSHIRSFSETNAERHSCGGSYLGKFTLSGNCVLDNPMGIEQKTTYINICSPKGSQKTLLNLLSNKNKCRPPIQNPKKKNASALLPVPLTPNQEKNPTP